MSMTTDGQAPLIDLWGPGTWGLLHTCSFRYPESPTQRDRLDFHTFMWALANVIPCAHCRAHFTESLTANLAAPSAAPLGARKLLSAYLVDLHNDVNRRTNKPIWTYEQAEMQYGRRDGACPVPRRADRAEPPADKQYSGPPASHRGPASPVRILVLLLLWTVLTGSLLQARRKAGTPRIR